MKHKIDYFMRETCNLLYNKCEVINDIIYKCLEQVHYNRIPTTRICLFFRTKSELSQYGCITYFQTYNNMYYARAM